MWAGENDIKRPIAQEDYERVDGILKSHQLFVVQKGRLAVRQHSCWCPACHTQLAKGGTDGNFQKDFCCAGCINKDSNYKWRNESCSQKTGGDVAAAWKLAKQGRAKNAKQLTPGQWAVLLAPDDEDEEFWLARTVAMDKWGGRCWKVHNALTTVNKVRFDAGDVEIAVQWYARVAGSASPRKYQIEADEPVAHVSSTILLAQGNGIMTHVAGPRPRMWPGTRRGTAKHRKVADERKRTWGLATTAENVALIARYVNQRE